MNCEPKEQLSGEGKTVVVDWNYKSDKCFFDMKKIVEMSNDLCVTKRGVLKRLPTFYDPLGLIQPHEYEFFPQGAMQT